MARLPAASKERIYTIGDFILSGTHEHVVSEDVVNLTHSGDVVLLGTRNRPEVSSILVQIHYQMDLKYKGPAGIVTQSEGTHTFDDKQRIEAGSTVTVECKEHYNTASITLPNGAVQTGLNLDVGNVDIRITLLEVATQSGGTGRIGQTDTVAGVAWDDVLNGIGWVLGGLACIMTAYVIYRFYKHFRHGEALFPRLNKLMGRGEE